VDDSTVQSWSGALSEVQYRGRQKREVQYSTKVVRGIDCSTARRLSGME
jgi:hypothetical protein